MGKRYITLLILGGLMFLSFLSGCNSQKITKNTDHEKALEILLYEKYNLEFQVEQLEKETPLKGLSSIIYGGEVTVAETGETFYANITEDNSAIQDTYPQTIYDDEIQKRMDNVLASHSEITVLESNYKYFASDETWSSIEEIDDYMSNGPSFAMIDISVSGNSTADVAKIISDFLMDLKENSFRYNVSCDIHVNEAQWTSVFATVRSKNKTHDYDTVLQKIEGHESE